MKQELARRLTARFHGADRAREAEREFESVFAGGGVPEDVPEFEFEFPTRVIEMLVGMGMAGSKGEARRLIKQGALSIDGERFVDSPDSPGLAPRTQLSPGSYLIKVGKRRFTRVSVKG